MLPPCGCCAELLALLLRVLAEWAERAAADTPARAAAVQAPLQRAALAALAALLRRQACGHAARDEATAAGAALAAAVARLSSSMEVRLGGADLHVQVL